MINLHHSLHFFRTGQPHSRQTACSVLCAVRLCSVGLRCIYPPRCREEPLSAPGLPLNPILGNSATLGGRKGPRSNNLGPLLHIPRRARTINSAGLPSNGRRGESSDYRQLLFASPPSSRTDRRILSKQIASCCKTGQRGVSLEAAPCRVPSGTPGPCG